MAERRADRVAGLWGALQSQVARSRLSVRGEAAKRACFDLIREGGELHTAIHSTGADRAATLRVERESVRPVALKVRRFAQRENFFVSEPSDRWGKPAAPTQANHVYANVASDARDAVLGAIEGLGLDLVEPDPMQPAEAARWNAIASASVAVFDIRPARTGEEVAEACLEIGMAQVLGTGVFVLAAPQQPHVFDLNVGRVQPEEHAVAEALDRAIYGWPLVSSQPDAFTRSLEWAERRLRTADDPLAGTSAGFMARAPHAIEARRAVDAALHNFSTVDAFVHTSNWPPDYPEPGRRRCFHITPFGKPWAPKTKALIETVCESRGVEFLRGDDDHRPEIIPAIVSAIARSTDSVADLTGLTLNAAYEVGIAQALGRDLLLLVQKQELESRRWSDFPMVQRTRLAAYQLDDEGAEDHLTKVVDRYLGRPDDARGIFSRA